MGRLFSGAATDKIQTTGTYTWPALNTFAAWVYRTGAGGGNLGVVCHKANAATRVFNDATTLRFLADWSGTDGEWSCPIHANDAWTHLAVTYDSGATTNDPLIYINGASQTVTEASAPTTAYNTAASALTIGNNGASNNRNYGGRLCEVAHYNVILSAAEILALASKVRPIRVRREALLRYLPVFGFHSAEPDYTTAADSGVLTGTALAEHAPVGPLWGKKSFSFPSAVAAAAGGGGGKPLMSLGLGLGM